MNIPKGPSAITAGWLTGVLREREILKEAVVTSLEMKSLEETVSGVVGQHVFLRLFYDIDELKAPHSLFAKFSTANPEMRAILHAIGLYQREVGFYDHIADKVKLRTPRCYYSALDMETGESVLLLEDMTPGRTGKLVDGCSLAQAELALGEIAKFHAGWWNSHLFDKMEWLPKVNPRGDGDTAYKEHWGQFIEKVGHLIPDSLIEIGERFGKYPNMIQQKQAETPQTLIHDDYQLENLFFTPSHSGVPFAVVDWTTLGFGRGVTDVAYFCSFCLWDKRAANEIDLLRFYHTTLLRNGVQHYSFDQCLLDYRLLTLHALRRMIFIIGTGLLSLENEDRFRWAVKLVIPSLDEALIRLNVSELLQ
ncbi:MAG: phosphotransferase [Anaerolineae bacterium]